MNSLVIMKILYNFHTLDECTQGFSRIYYYASSALYQWVEDKGSYFTLFQNRFQRSLALDLLTLNVYRDASDFDEMIRKSFGKKMRYLMWISIQRYRCGRCFEGDDDVTSFPAVE